MRRRSGGHFLHILRSHRYSWNYAGVVLGMLALALQLLGPVAHLYDVATEWGTALPQPATPAGVAVHRGDTVALLAPAATPRRAPHDPATCSVCQTLAQLRPWNLTRDGIIVQLPQLSHPAQDVRVAPLHLSRQGRAPRAPPVASC